VHYLRPSAAGLLIEMVDRRLAHAVSEEQAVGL
jgi:hypothetical protein